MKPFLLFLFYSILTSVFSVSLALIEIFRCFVFDGKKDTDEKVCNLDENKGAPEVFYELSTSLTGVGLFFILGLGFLTLAIWFS